MNKITDARRFALIERPRGEDRVTALGVLPAKAFDADARYERLREEIAKDPARYAPVGGTHQLVVVEPS